MLKVEEHEKNINDLIQMLKVEGVDQAKVSTIVQALRDNYTEVDQAIITNTKKIEEINGLNEGLRSANMGLLSKLGTQIADLGNRGNHQEQKQDNTETEDKPLSLDDISKEFLK